VEEVVQTYVQMMIKERAPSTSTGYCCCSCWLKYTTSNSLSNKQQQTTNKQIQLQQIHLLQTAGRDYVTTDHGSTEPWVD
jgi:hypothetical protein